MWANKKVMEHDGVNTNKNRYNYCHPKRMFCYPTHLNILLYLDTQMILAFYLKRFRFDTHMRVKIQKIREGTPYQSYRIALPKAIIEAKKWEDVEFELEDKGDKLELKAVK